jgi:RHS repeat-associated protein
MNELNKFRTATFPRFSLILLMIISLLSNTFVLAGKAYVRDYAIGGEVKLSGTPVSGKVVLTKFVTGSGPDWVFVPGQTMSGTSGIFTFIVPCYVPNPWMGIGMLSQPQAKVIGATGSGATWQGTSYGGCNWADNTFINVIHLAITGYTEGDHQNAGPSCPQVAHPVNVTNGNMWLQETDYRLPGIGENINITRTYNSVIQSSGFFGYGWRTDLDSAIVSYDADSIGLDIGTGRRYYFINNGANTFLPVNGLINASIAKNTDSTYTLTYKDGRVHKYHANGRLNWMKDPNGNQTTLSYSGANGAGNITGITDGFGHTLTIVTNTNGTVQKMYDSLGSSSDPFATYDYDTGTTRLKTVTYRDGSKYKYEYDTTTASGKTLLTTVKDALDNVLETHAYDSQARATTSEVAGGYEKYTFDYSNWTATAPYTSVTFKKSSTDPTIENKYYFDKSFGYNIIKKSEGVCSCSGGSQNTQYIYDGRQRLVKIINALGHEKSFTYDANGNILTQTLKVGTTTLGTDTMTYNSFGQVLTWTDRMGGVKTYTYDTHGNVLTLKDVLNNTTTLNYPTTGNKGLPSSIVDARSNQTNFTWNSAGLLQEIEDPYGKKTDYTYDARGRTLTVTNALLDTVTYNYYDDTTRKMEVVYPNSDKITYKYDIRRLPQSVTDERGKITSYEYDSARHLTKVTDPLGHYKEFDYDGMSNLAWSKDALGNQTDYQYDDSNRLVEVKSPAPTTSATRLTKLYEYDQVGRITKFTDGAARVVNYVYDDLNLKRTAVNAELESTVETMNLRGQLIQVKDANNQTYDFTYDPNGHMLTQSHAGSTETYEYDVVGNLKKRTDYSGRVTNYTHDNLNRLTKAEYGYPTVISTSTFAYDNISRPISATNENGTVLFAFDSRNRLTSTTDVFNHTLNYIYTTSSTVNQKRVKLDGTNYADYNYDDANRLTDIVRASDSTTTTFGYDNTNHLTSKVLPNGITTSYEYDGMSRLTRLKDETSSAVLYDRQYGYNTASQINQITEPSRTRTFGYDNADRLTSETDGTTSESYTYDDAGNRTASHLSSAYGYQSGKYNRLTSTNTASYGYDSNGNMTSKTSGTDTWSYNWDYENRITSAAKGTDSAEYKYDALGRRIERTRASTNEDTKFIYDGADVLADDNGGALTKYLNGAGIDNKLRVEDSSGVKYFLVNHEGSTEALTDISGSVTSSNDYDSFGNATGNLGTRYGFTGREHDDFSGLNYYRARWYDSQLGRFISEDPAGLAGGDTNLYGYVRNNPANLRDPSGKFIVPLLFLAGIGLLILLSPSTVNAPKPGDPIYYPNNPLILNAMGGAVCEAILVEALWPIARPFLGKAFTAVGDYAGYYLGRFLPEGTGDAVNAASSGGGEIVGGWGDDLEKALTPDELAKIKELAAKHDTEFDIVGSRGDLRGRNIDTDLPVGKGEYSRSDIDIKVPIEAIEKNYRIIDDVLNMGEPGYIDRLTRHSWGTKPPYIRVTKDGYTIVRE